MRSAFDISATKNQHLEDEAQIRHLTYPSVSNSSEDPPKLMDACVHCLNVIDKTIACAVGVLLVNLELRMIHLRIELGSEILLG